MHQSKQIIAPTDVSLYTTKKGDSMISKAEEVFFLTKEQVALKTSQLMRVIMTSDYGTGKTTLMKSVIKDLRTPAVAPNRGKIFIVVPLSDSSMLYQSFEAFAETFSDVEVRAISPSGMLKL